MVRNMNTPVVIDPLCDVDVEDNDYTFEAWESENRESLYKKMRSKRRQHMHGML
jgi:hypothetical protein